MATALSAIKGGAELQKFLNTLPAKIEQNIMRSALRAGANDLKQAAKDNINDVSGDLAKSVRVGVRTRGGKIRATVKAGDAKAYYVHMVEYGTSAHEIISKSGLAVNGQVFTKINHPGAAPHPFMRPAVDSNTQSAINAITNQVKKRLTKEGINMPDGGDE